MASLTDDNTVLQMIATASRHAEQADGKSDLVEIALRGTQREVQPSHTLIERNRKHIDRLERRMDRLELGEPRIEVAVLQVSQRLEQGTSKESES